MGQNRKGKLPQLVEEGRECGGAGRGKGGKNQKVHIKENE